MDGRSISSLTTLCSGISQRAISGANELRSLVEALGSSNRNVLSVLTSLASGLEELNQRAAQLDAALVTATVAMLVQDGLKEHLTSCDGMMTVLYKQLMRLQPDNIKSLNVDFVVAYYQAAMAYSRLLESMEDIVQM